VQKRTICLVLLWLVYYLPVLSYAQNGYSPSKVVYDVTTSNAVELELILDRVSFLQNVYNNNPFDASIVLVIHNEAIPVFVNTNPKYANIRQRAKSLTLGEIIQFRVCEASAKIQGFSHEQFDTFLQLVPMADAEIIQLQNLGYAYLR